MRRVSLSEPSFSFDPDDPDGFRSGVDRFGPLVGASRTGASLYELPPGQALCPYHYEYGEEEWALVIEGRPSVRSPEGTEVLEPLEMVFFPKGPAGAHQIRNDGDAPVRVLMWSDVVHPTGTAYPDSDKVALFTGVPGEDLMAVRTSQVDYFFGETNT